MVLAGVLGLSIDRGDYTFSPKTPGEACMLFLSFPGCYGTFHAANGRVSVAITGGRWCPKRIVVDAHRVPGETTVVKLDGADVPVKAYRRENQLFVSFPSPVEVSAGKTVVIR
jgi:hypothetical protein